MIAGIAEIARDREPLADKEFNAYWQRNETGEQFRIPVPRAIPIPAMTRDSGDSP